MHRQNITRLSSIVSTIYVFTVENASPFVSAFQINSHNVQLQQTIPQHVYFSCQRNLAKKSPFRNRFKNIKKNLHYSSTSLLQSNYKTSTSSSSTPFNKFERGAQILAEVTRFGKLGASVDIVGVGGHSEDFLIDEYDPPLASGLILQSEISYFRRKRNMLDVVVGEILPAYVEQTRYMEDGNIKIDVTLRPPGYAKSVDLAVVILKKLEDRLEHDQNDTLDVGDKSTPSEIDAEFPGTSKSAFKKAVSALYKEGKVKPGPYSITLMK